MFKQPLIILSIFFVSLAWSGPTINSADLAVIARNTDLDDQFALVALAEIPGSSVVFLTDEGWDDSDFTFDSSEDVFKWTVHASGITAGTIIRFTNESTTTLEIENSSHGTISSSNGSSDMNLSAGDQLFIYQTSDDTYNGTIQRKDGSGGTEAGMIYAFNGDNSSPSTNGWLNAGNSHTSAASQVPDNMTVLSTSNGSGNANIANAFGMLTQAALKDSSADEYDNYKYDGPTTSATKIDWLIRLHTTANWLASDTDSLSLNTGVLSSNLTVSSPNTLPTISIDNLILGYTEENPAVQIDGAGTASDADGDSDWNTGTLTAQITANSESGDELSIPDNVVGSINTSGTNILNGATVIGTLSASEGTVTNGTKLTITFDSDATNALVQQVLRSISYKTNSEDPGTSNRIVTFVVTDANSGSSNDSRTISVAKFNDVPTITTNNGLVLNEGATSSLLLASLEANDVDSDNAALTYTLTSSASNGQLENTDNTGVSISSFTQQNLTDGKIQYVHDDGNTTSDNLIFKVSDGIKELTGQIYSITINAINDDTPTILTNNGITLNEGAVALIPLSSLESNDLDSDNLTLVYSVTSASSNGRLENTDNSGVSITSFTQQNLSDGKVRYVHNGSNTTSDSFVFSVSDGLNELSSNTFNIIINAENDTPVLTSLTNQSMNEDDTLEILLSMTVSSDEETSLTNANLLIGAGSNYSVSGRLLIPNPNFNGSLQVPIQITDGEDSSAVLNMTVTVLSILDTSVQVSSDTSLSMDTISVKDSVVQENLDSIVTTQNFKITTKTILTTTDSSTEVGSFSNIIDTTITLDTLQISNVIDTLKHEKVAALGDHIEYFVQEFSKNFIVVKDQAISHISLYSSSGVLLEEVKTISSPIVYWKNELKKGVFFVGFRAGNQMKYQRVIIKE